MLAPSMSLRAALALSAVSRILSISAAVFCEELVSEPKTAPPVSPSSLSSALTPGSQESPFDFEEPVGGGGELFEIARGKIVEPVGDLVESGGDALEFGRDGIEAGEQLVDLRLRRHREFGDLLDDRDHRLADRDEPRP